MQKPLEISLPLRIKSYDIDVAGIVSNIVYVRWLEDLRLKMLDTYHPLEDQLKADYAPVLMQTEIQYKKQLTIFDKPVGHMWMSKLGKLKWEVTAEIRVDGTLAARAEQYGCFVNITTQRPLPIPPDLLEYYQSRCATVESS